MVESSIIYQLSLGRLPYHGLFAAKEGKKNVTPHA
jgi:hypothetical protein